MAFDMNKDRINRWKCLFCGSKHKKVIEHIREKDGAHIGCTLHCCNCGHIDNFAWTVNFAKQLTNEAESMTSEPCVHCGLSKSDLVNCKKYDCKYRPNFEEEKKPKVHSTIANPDEMAKPAPTDLDGGSAYHPELHRTKDQVLEGVPDLQKHMKTPPIDIPGQVGPRYVPPYVERHHDEPLPGKPMPVPGTHQPPNVEVYPNDPPDMERPGMNENGMPRPRPIEPPKPTDDLVVPIVNGTVGRL